MRPWLLATLTLMCLLLTTPARALDLTNGVMIAVPVPAGKAPAIDGDLADWDLSAMEPLWQSPETAADCSGQIAVMYDDEAIYVGGQITLPARHLRNPNGPQDGFWWGDALQFRMVSDPAIPHPLQKDANQDSTRVIHATIWKNTQTKTDYLHLTFGASLGSASPSKLNPEGCQAIIKEGKSGYVLEAKITWAALNVPGGKNPFQAGQRMTGIFELLWGNDSTRIAGPYVKNPGVFAFLNPGTWGQIEFSAKGNLPPRHETMAEALARLTPKPVGLPIDITMPERMKLAVNIVAADGSVIRELCGGEWREKGTTKVYWDGRDQWGTPLPPGDYKWAAYMSQGLRVQYMGTVGTSGQPAYETADGKGGWGADHSAPISCAADTTGWYFLWSVAEAGKAVVKTDFEGHALWRKTPFVGGGFGPHYSLAANDKYCFVTWNKERTHILRLDAATGALLPWNGISVVPMMEANEAAPATPKKSNDPNPNAGLDLLSTAADSLPQTCGLAVLGKEVFVPVYNANAIRILDGETGTRTRELPCPAPRGVALDKQGNLWAISGKTVVTFTGTTGTPRPVVTDGLTLPYALAVDDEGRLHVTDAATHQLKVFDHDGKPLRVMGQPGGRTWAGKYDNTSFLRPRGLAADGRGGILLAEDSLPKPISRLDAATGKTLKQWFGSIAYCGANVPDPLDPWTSYYTLNDGLARGRVPKAGAVGDPEASWVMPEAGHPEVGRLIDSMGVPQIFVAGNGRKYLAANSAPRGICLIEGDNLVPVGRITIIPDAQGGGVELWSDLNADGKIQPEEVQTVKTAGGLPIKGLTFNPGTSWITPSGDLYLVSGSANCVYEIPGKFQDNGRPAWDGAQARVVVPKVVARAQNGVEDTWRHGILGAQPDTKGNIYCVYNVNVPYATPGITKRMQDGLGHTATFNAVKFTKFGPDGKELWTTGRKAIGPARPGEIYHHWLLAGLVGDQYVATASEWGQFYFYTSDGFYVDAIFNNMGLPCEAGPYTFGSETFAGKLVYFPQLDEVWAYSCGHIYRVEGFAKGGTVEGERRTSGTMHLDKIYDAPTDTAVAGPLQIVPLHTPFDDEKAWAAAPVQVMKRDGKDLAQIQLGYDDQFLYAKFHVADPTPLQNVSDNVNMAFKWGDCVGLDLGPAGQRTAPVLGDVRLLAALINKKPVLVAMKPLTKLAAKPERYFTPAAGERKFEFVGEIPGGKLELKPDPDGQGYTAVLAVPLTFIETKIAPGIKLAADAEVLLSGQAARGLQTASRNYLFSAKTPATQMIDDVPTEATLYTNLWGVAEVK